MHGTTVKIYKCNNYEYNKHNLISVSGHRFTALHFTLVNINARQKKPYNTHNRIPEIYLRSSRINNNVLVVQVIQNSSAHYKKLSWAKKLCTNLGLFQQVLFL